MTVTANIKAAAISFKICLTILIQRVEFDIVAIGRCLPTILLETLNDHFYDRQKSSNFEGKLSHGSDNLYQLAYLFVRPNYLLSVIGIV